MEQNIKLADKTKCTGCASCMNTCSRNAISLEEGENGFRYPVIDVERCIQCGACSESCPELTPLKKSNFYRAKAYAAVNRDSQSLTKGSSGSVFMEIGLEVLSRGGVVYGCAWECDKKVSHICISEKESINKVLKSKYLQSDIGYCYRDVKEKLNLGKEVVFSGTPCQIAGLKKYLRKDYSNLLCVDVVCHGVPNQHVFSDFIDCLEKREKGRVTNYCFREKSRALGNYSTSYLVGTKRKIIQWTLISYGYLFMYNYLSRESCYQCQYANIDRISDITLGDFWGIDHLDKSFDSATGVSAVIVNSDKGARIFCQIREKFIVKEFDYKDVYDNNEQLRKPSIKPSDWEDGWKAYRKSGYSAFEKLYRKKTLGLRIRAFIKLCVIRVIRKDK